MTTSSGRNLQFKVISESHCVPPSIEPEVRSFITSAQALTLTYRGYEIKLKVNEKNN